MIYYEDLLIIRLGGFLAKYLNTARRHHINRKIIRITDESV